MHCFDPFEPNPGTLLSSHIFCDSLHHITSILMVSILFRAGFTFSRGRRESRCAPGYRNKTGPREIILFFRPISNFLAIYIIHTRNAFPVKFSEDPFLVIYIKIRFNDAPQAGLLGPLPQNRAPGHHTSDPPSL